MRDVKKYIVLSDEMFLVSIPTDKSGGFRTVAQVEEELQAYQASGLMRHEYTRSPHSQNITSSNKV